VPSTFFYFGLTWIIREHEDAEARFCYKHDVKSMFKQEMRLPRD